MWQTLSAELAWNNERASASRRIRISKPNLSMARRPLEAQVGGYAQDNFWLNCLDLSGTGISEPDLLKLTRGNFKRRVLLRSG